MDSSHRIVSVYQVNGTECDSDHMRASQRPEVRGGLLIENRLVRANRVVDYLTMLNWGNNKQRHEANSLGHWFKNIHAKWLPLVDS